MIVKHVRVSSKDKKPTIRNSEIEKLVNKDAESILVSYELNNELYNIKYNKTRNGKTWYAERELPLSVNSPLVGKPVYIEVKQLISI